MAFTRQHYVAIANILLSSGCSHELCSKFADYFERDNERFDRQVFLEACGYA